MPLASAAPRVINIGPNGTSDNGMRLVKTRHYEIHTDLDAALVTDLANRMDVMYDEYTQRLREFHPPTDAPAMPVYLFTHEADYAALTGNMGTNTGGIFVFGGKKTYLAAFLGDQGRDKLRHTLQHEAFHQFAYFAISHDLPIWLNEGLAQFFEEGIWTGKNFWINQVPPERLWDLQDQIKKHKLIEFQRFLDVTPDQWHKNLSGSLAAGDLYYQQAWAMVQFLVDGSHPDYRTRLIDYLKRLHNNESPDKAFEAAFSKNIKGFQDRFAEWIVNL
ncbi:MAG TPA: DUF1570 domain-containing protein, partial [Tepidisphaeraceae bacterium]|nr:DUF1570 domain-containing protein [Tepidisphaeraceae bacterium]